MAKIALYVHGILISINGHILCKQIINCILQLDKADNSNVVISCSRLHPQRSTYP